MEAADYLPSPSRVLTVFTLFVQGTADLEREDEEEMEDSGEVLDDSSSSPSSTLKNYPLTCKVLYSYKVPAELELAIISARNNNHNVQKLCTFFSGYLMLLNKQYNWNLKSSAE